MSLKKKIEFITTLATKIKGKTKTYGLFIISIVSKAGTAKKILFNNKVFIKVSSTFTKILDKVKNSIIYKKLIKFLNEHPLIVISIIAPIFFISLLNKSYNSFNILTSNFEINSYLYIIIIIVSFILTYIIKKYIYKKGLIYNNKKSNPPHSESESNSESGVLKSSLCLPSNSTVRGKILYLL